MSFGVNTYVSIFFKSEFIEHIFSRCQAYNLESKEMQSTASIHELKAAMQNMASKQEPDTAPNEANTPYCLLNPVHLETSVDTCFILDTIFMGIN